MQILSRNAWPCHDLVLSCEGVLGFDKSLPDVAVLSSVLCRRCSDSVTHVTGQRYIRAPEKNK